MFSNRVLVPVGGDTAKKEDSTRTPDEAMKSPPRRKLLPLWLAILGMVSLSYLLGAAVMFFHFPSSDFLGKAFMGARAWNERRQALSGPRQEGLPQVSLGRIDKPEKTFDGFTLCTYASLSSLSTQAFLINMHGNVVHKWVVRFSDVWPNPPHIRGRVNDSLVCIFACYLYPNGDLLAVFHGMEHVTSGYGLAKLDKDSHVLWRYSANVHHDVDVGEDGTIYAIQHEIVNKMPTGLEFIRTPCLVDSLVLLSADGKQLRKPIPILEAFRDSPYSPLLSSYEGLKEEDVPIDLMHTNCAQVLTRKLAPKFPGFQAGQVLISVRELDTIAVLDTEKCLVTWAARGPWRAQHDAQFLDNGHILIFDNLGVPSKRSRVLEYDPQTQAFPWSYSGENGAPFYTADRGMSQRLPNGNTLIVNSLGGTLLEVTQSKELVWSASFKGGSYYICTGRRYSPEQLEFMKGGPRARP